MPGRALARALPLEGCLVAITLAVLGLRFLVREAHYPLSPTSVARSGWWWWTDQYRYLLSARAWAAGNLDPSQHWYLPGYPLLGALFVHITPAQPFLIPDLLCLLAACWAFAALTGGLLPGLAGARLLGAVVFTGATLLRHLALDAWIIPWSTTPVAPLVFAALALALDFGAAPRPRTAFLVALCCGAIIPFRIAEALPVTLAAGAFGLAAVLRARPGWRGAAAIAGAALAGGVIPILLALPAHLAVNGWSIGPYLAQSRGVGFAWSLIPLRWATIMLDPRPLFGDGEGLAAAFPWILPGIAGMAACLAAPTLAGRSRHALVIGATALHVALFLAYRDLHPQGLWRFNNYHYFKWTIPVFALYALFMLAHLVRRTRWRALLAGVLALAVLLPWRAEFAPGRAGAAVLTGPHAVALPAGFGPAGDAVLLAADGEWNAIYAGVHTLHVGGRTWYMGSDIKAVPVPGGLLMLALRDFHRTPATLRFAPSVTLAPIPPVFGRERVVFGFPCGLMPLFRQGCEPVTHAR